MFNERNSFCFIWKRFFFVKYDIEWEWSHMNLFCWYSSIGLRLNRDLMNLIIIWMLWRALKIYLVFHFWVIKHNTRRCFKYEWFVLSQVNTYVYILPVVVLRNTDFKPELLTWVIVLWVYNISLLWFHYYLP